MPQSRSVTRWLSFVLLFLSLDLWPGATTPLALADHGGRSVLVLPVEYVKVQFDSGRQLTAVDLRAVEDYRRGHLPGARSVPLSDLVTRFSEIPTLGLVVLYCECPRSDAEGAYQFLRAQGYRNLSVMAEGFGAWMKQGYPIER